MTPVWQRLTLRHRTALIITLFIWVTGALVGLICRGSFQRLTYRQTDIELSDDANDFVMTVEAQPLPWTSAQTDLWNRRVAIHPLHRLFIRVLDTQNELIWESITAPNPPPIGLDRFDLAVQPAGTYHVVHRPIQLQFSTVDDSEPTRATSPAILQVGCSLDLVRSTMAQFDVWLLSTLGPLILGAPLLSWFLAVWLLDPLKQLTRETDSIPIEADQLVSRTQNGDEIDRLAETVNSLLVRVRSHLRDNEDWIADSAHQLRGPLAAIVSNVEVVAGRIPDGKSSAMLNRVLMECEYLKKLVNQLLLLSEAKADRHQPIRHRIAWHELVAKSSDFYEALAQANDLEIHFPQLDPCTVLANPEHLRFVIHNVIDNAIKYTPEGGRIDVSMQRDDANGVCSLRVRDTGIGISEDDLAKIGRRFYRSNSGRDPLRTPKGSGLGLHIVRSIVDSLRGSFEITSKLGDGTEVLIQLPMVQDEISLGSSSKPEAVR